MRGGRGAPLGLVGSKAVAVMVRPWQSAIGAVSLAAIVALALKVSASGTRPVRGGSAARGASTNGDREPRARPARRARRTAKANVWTVPHGDGWANKRDGAKRVAKVFPTKTAAQAAGRTTAQREKVEHIILKRDGEIGERNSYGNDPTRSQG